MQGKRLYVANFSYTVTESDLKELFSNYEVRDVVVIRDRGFGFVELSSPEEAEAAKEELNGREYTGRTLEVAEARPRRERF